MGSNDEQTGSSPLVTDLTGVGNIINSEIAQKAYEDGVAPGMQEVGGLTQDVLKSLRLFTAPLQLMGAYQDRLAAFCDRVRAKVPPENQQEAPPEIVAPVMKALATTGDDSPLMEMFEELMARAIDTTTADTLNPGFPDLIKSLSPLQAKLLKSLAQHDHVSDVLMELETKVLRGQVYCNYSADDFGGSDHHLTLVQDLAHKQLVVDVRNVLNQSEHYPNLEVPEGLVLFRMTRRLSMNGRWFAQACIAPPPSPSQPPGNPK